MPLRLPSHVDRDRRPQRRRRRPLERLLRPELRAAEDQVLRPHLPALEQAARSTPRADGLPHAPRGLDRATRGAARVARARAHDAQRRVLAQGGARAGRHRRRDAGRVHPRAHDDDDALHELVPHGAARRRGAGRCRRHAARVRRPQPAHRGRERDPRRAGGPSTGNGVRHRGEVRGHDADGCCRASDARLISPVFSHKFGWLVSWADYLGSTATFVPFLVYCSNLAF
jgi:hypothetical protein